MSFARATVEIARASLRVLRAHPRLLWFPALSALSVVLAAVFLLAPAVDARAGGNLGWGGADIFGLYDGEPEGPWWIALFAYTLVNGVTAYFAVALTHQALHALRGDTVSVKAGLRYSATRARAVGAYALINATLGIVFSAGRGARRSARSLFGVAWDLVTYLALPVMVQERRGAVESLRRSGRLFKQTWGETALAEVGLRVLAVQFYALVVLLCLLLANLFDEPAVPILFVALVLGLGFALLVSTLQAIYRAALYIFAAEGAIPDAFDTPDMHDVWRVK